MVNRWDSWIRLFLVGIIAFFAGYVVRDKVTARNNSTPTRRLENREPFPLPAVDVAPDVRGVEPTVASADTFLQLITSQDRAELHAALTTIEQQWHPGSAVMLVEAARFIRGNAIREAAMHILQAKTDQSFGGDMNAWYRWLWNEPYQPHPEYSQFKASLYSRLDKRFREYFEVTDDASIRLDEIRWGGVRRDGIPPLKDPATLPASDADYLADSNVVFGVAINGEARAYPKRILAWHEMVKDTIGGESINGVYCTLCGSMIVYRTHIGDKHYELGTSGFLYRSNKLMYDHDTKSLWSTLDGKPVVGPLVGQGIKLEPLSVVTTTWGQWREMHPETQVLSLETGYKRDYSEGAAYRDYFATDKLMFEVSKHDDRLKNKDEVLALRFDDISDERLAISAHFLVNNPIYHDSIGDRQFVVVTQDGGTNAMSRYAALRAMSESGTIAIDKYQHWTFDWSKSPNGNYYSNKAPGSFLLVLPAFWLIDTISLIWDMDNIEPSGIRGAPGHFQKTVLSFVSQIIPLLISLYFLAQILLRLGYSSISNQWMMAAVLFGSTASLFMNNMFGHGFATMLYLLSVLLWMNGWMLALGVSLSALILSDYSAALFLLPFVIAIGMNNQFQPKSFVQLAIGALPCFVLWAWYHNTAFGGIFSVATMYINPEMRDLVNQGTALFGVINIYPKMDAVFELLIGGKRGILVTQPWVLFVFFVSLYFFVRSKLSKIEYPLVLLVNLNLLFLFLFNASVGSWHAGFTAGPRYLTAALAGMALLIPVLWKRLNKLGKWTICGLIVYSIIFRAFVYGTTILAPLRDLWTWIIEDYAKSTSGTPFLRVAIFIILVSLAAWRVLKIEQKKY